MSRKPKHKNRREKSNTTVNIGKYPNEIPKPSWRNWMLALALLAIVVLAYLPAIRGGFIWDDDDHLTNNPHMNGLSGLASLWTSSAARICPLVLTSFWVQHALWGLHPWPYHLVNILMHATGGLVLWQVLRCLKVPGAWLCAALWALHPVQVESVAWITELKNTQSGVFYLLTIWFFVKWRQASLPPKPTAESPEKFYALALMCGALAMASKSSTVILPLVLGLCAWWVEGQWHWRNVLRLAPFFMFSAVASAISMWTQKLEGAGGAEWVRSWPERFVTAGEVVWFYLGKLLWPQQLIFIYPRWEITAAKLWSFMPVVAVVGLLVFLWVKRQTAWGRPLFLALMYFLMALLPVLSLVDHYFLRYSFVGDHFQYLASIGPLVLVGVGIERGLSWLAGRKSFLRPLVWTALLLTLGSLTWRQSHMYADEDTLWHTTLVRNPNCWMAYNNLGKNLIDQGRTDEGILHFQKALAIKPDFEEAHNNLGAAYVQMGRIEEGINEYHQALKKNPDYVEAHNNLGIAYIHAGRVQEGLEQFNQSLKLQPRFAPTHNNLAIVYLQTGHTEEAIQHARQAVEFDGRNLGTYNTLAAAYSSSGRIEEAVEANRRALEIQPGFAPAHFNLGNIWLQQGKLQMAIDEYLQAIKNQPDYTATYINLGVASKQAGQTKQAITAYRKALELDRSNIDTMNNLAWVLITSSSNSVHSAEALRLAEQANQLANGDNAQILRTLAAVYAKSGRYAEAIEAAQRALSSAKAQKNTALADVLQQEINLYEAEPSNHDR